MSFCPFSGLKTWALPICDGSSFLKCQFGLAFRLAIDGALEGMRNCSHLGSLQLDLSFESYAVFGGFILVEDAVEA